MHSLLKRGMAVIAGAAMLSAGQAALATTDGYTTPLGLWNRGDAGTAYVTFDTFTATTGADIANVGSQSGFTSAQLGQSVTPSGFDMVLGPGMMLMGETASGSGIYDRLYAGKDANAWTATGSLGFSAKTVILQVKQHSSTSFSYGDFQLNGLAPDLITYSSYTEGALNQPFATIAWFDVLASESLTDLALTFGVGPFSHASLDGLQLDVSNAYRAVPEPASAGLALVGCCAVLWRRGRRA